MPHTRPEIDAEVSAAIRAIRDVEKLTVEQARELLQRLRERVVVAVAESGALDAATAQAVKRRTAALVDEYEARLREQMSDNQQRMFVRGIKLVDDVVKTGDITTALPYVDEENLRAAQQFSAELITNLAADVRARIAQEINLAVLGQKGSADIIRALGRNLKDPSVFGTIRRRSEIIVRQEVNRVQAQATRARLEQTARQVPDLGREWQHSGLGHPPRANHLAMDGDVAWGDQLFELRSADGQRVYKIWGPHDPKLPPDETIGCRCLAAPVVGRYRKKTSRGT